MRGFKGREKGVRRLVPFWARKDRVLYFGEPELVPLELVDKVTGDLLASGAVSVVVQRKEKVVWEEEKTYRRVDKGANRE